MNELGLGVTFSAADLASGAIQKVGSSLLGLVGTTSTAGAAIKASLKELSVGMALFGGGALIAGGLGVATQEAGEFSRSIAEIATEADLAAFPVKAMREQAMALGSTFAKLPVEEAKAMYKAVAFGADTATKSLGLMAASNTLAVAGVTDVQTAMDGIGATVKAYGMDFGQATDVSDAFFVAMKSGNTRVADLAASIGRINPTAAALKVNFDVILAAISTLTGKGIQASEAVSGLKAALANIQHPTSDAAAEAAKLGVKFTAAELRAKGLPAFLNAITSSAQFTADSFTKLFGSVEGVTAIQALAANGGADFAKILDAMGQRAGATAAGFDIITNTLGFQQDRFKALKSTALIMIGEVLEPMAASAVRLGNALLEAFTKIPAPVREFMVRAAAVSSAILMVVGGAIAAKAAITMLIAGLSAIGVTFTGVVATIAPVVAALGVVALGFYALREAYERNLGGLGVFVDVTVAKVSLGVKALAQLFEEGGFSGAVLDELDAGNEGVEHFVIRLYLAATRIEAFFGNMKDAIVATIDAAKPAFDGLSAALNRLTGDVGGMTAAIDGAAAGEEFDSWGRAGKRAGEVIGQLAVKLVEALTVFIDFATAVKPAVVAVMDFVTSAGGLKTVLEALRIGLIALTAYGIAQATMGLVELGSSGISAATSIAKLVASMATMNGASFAGAASSAVAAVKGLTSSAASALGPVGALTAAITALYLAYDQYTKLDKELGEHGWSDMMAKLKNDLGITSDEEYQKYLGINQPVARTQSPEQAKRDEATAQARAFLSPGLTPEEQAQALAFYAPDVPTAAVQNAAGASFNTDALNAGVSELASAAGELRAAKEAPIAVNATFNVDGEAMAKVVTKAQKGAAFNNANPLAFYQD